MRLAVNQQVNVGYDFADRNFALPMRDRKANAGLCQMIQQQRSADRVSCRHWCSMSRH